tara:strand:- start:42 stop:992 length:951 start_codon:yes stop_codon:yes gene_type:complete
MLFQLKKKKQKSSQDPKLSPKVDKIKTILKKVKFVARNVIYVKKWSKNSPLLQKIKTENNSHIKSKKLNFHHGSIELRIIDDTDELMYKVKKLRYESFFGESDKNKYDSDEFDKSCDHLVAIDKSISDDYIVGTYRLLLKPKFVKSQKFYSQTEFNISKLTKKRSLTLLEAGRSCVHKNYRDGSVIKLLWRGLATYIVKNQVDIVFGCASFPSSNHNLFRNQLSYLKYFHSSPQYLKTKPLWNLKVNFRTIDKKLLNSNEEFRKLPPLIKAYIRVGAYVGSGAIVDKEFDTTDVLIVLETKKMLKKYSNLYLKNIH